MLSLVLVVVWMCVVSIPDWVILVRRLRAGNQRQQALR